MLRGSYQDLTEVSLYWPKTRDHPEALQPVPHRGEGGMEPGVDDRRVVQVLPLHLRRPQRHRSRLIIARPRPAANGSARRRRRPS